MLLDRLEKPSRLLTGQLCLIELVAWGILYYTFSVFLPAMEEELDWSSATLSAGFALAVLISGLVAPSVGAWIDQRGSRGLMLTGSVLGAVGIALWGISYSIYSFFAAWCLIGLSMAATLYAPAFATVVRLSGEKSRSAIVSITLVGALASTLFMPNAAYLGDQFGWRIALVILAVLLAVVTVPLTAMLPRLPKKEFEERQTRSSESSQKAFRQFQKIAVSLMLADGASVAVTVYLVAFLLDQGLTLQAAAYIVGLAGVAKLGGRLVTAMNISSLLMLRLALITKAVVLILPLIWPANWSVFLMVLGFGATSGAETILRPAIVVELFGSKSFGKSNGVLQLLTTLSKASGPVIFGAFLSIAGWSYSWSAMAAIVALSFFLLLLVDITIPVRKDQELQATFSVEKAD